MKHKLKKIYFVLGIISLILWVINTILNMYTVYKLNIEFLTSLPLSVILFSFFGLMSFCYLMNISNQKATKILYVFIAVGFIYILGVLVVFGSEKVKRYELASETAYVREFRFLFGGEDHFYKRDNFIWSHYIDTFPNNEDAYTSYTYYGNVLIATVNSAGSQNDVIEVTVIDFENS